MKALIKNGFFSDKEIREFKILSPNLHYPYGKKWKWQSGGGCAFFSLMYCLLRLTCPLVDRDTILHSIQHDQNQVQVLNRFYHLIVRPALQEIGWRTWNMITGILAANDISRQILNSQRFDLEETPAGRSFARLLGVGLPALALKTYRQYKSIQKSHQVLKR